MRNLIIVVIVIAAIAAALWYTPQGRSLLKQFGVTSPRIETRRSTGPFEGRFFSCAKWRVR
jgi:hypothetical protein